MGNIVDSDAAADDRPFTSCSNPQDELVMSLRSFVFLYDQHERRLQRATQSFTEAAAPLRNDSSPSCPFSFLGGAVGGVCGGVAGVVGGSLGAVAAATCGKLCGRINAVEATVGLFGSVFGGAAGGVFSGAVGGAVGVVVTPLGDDRAVNKAVWCAVGLVTGGAIGGIFGGTCGAAGGAVGGGFGALCGTSAAFKLFGGSVVEKRGSDVKSVQDAADEFRASLDPLLQPLRVIDTASAESQGGDQERRVAAQASRTLVAVTTAQRLMSNSRRAGRPREFEAAAAKRSSEITEELRRMREEATNFLRR